MVAFMLLHWNETVSCCSAEHTLSQCLYNTLRPLQFVVSFICAAVIIVFYIYYFKQKDELIAHPTGNGETWKGIKWKVVVLCCTCCLVVLVAVAIGVLPLFNEDQGNARRKAVEEYSDALSVAAAVITSIHWTPQLLETWRLQSLGSLSLALLVLQSVGCILTFVSVSKGGIIVGVPYLVASLMQFVLIFMSISFACRDTQSKKVEHGDIQRGTGRGNGSGGGDSSTCTTGLLVERN